MSPRMPTACALGAALLVLLPQATAAADTAAAAATAASVTTLGSTVISGQAAASNDGSQAGTDQGGQQGLSVLGSQSLITSGVLSQHAVARSDGSSAACAGVVGAGGYVSIGADGSCTITSGSSGGVVVTLNSLVKIKADAIVSSCTATSSGSVTARAQLVNAAVYTTTGLTTTSSALDASPAPNSSVTVTGVANLGLNGRSTPSGAGSVRVSALTVSLLSGTASAMLAASTCGPNATVLPTSALPLQGLPLAGGLPLAVAAAWWARHRRRPLCAS